MRGSACCTPGSTRKGSCLGAVGSVLVCCWLVGVVEGVMVSGDRSVCVVGVLVGVPCALGGTYFL